MVKTLVFKVLVIIFSILVNLGIFARLSFISRRKVRRISYLSYGIFALISMAIEIYLLFRMSDESYSLAGQMRAGAFLMSVYFSQALVVLACVPKFLWVLICWIGRKIGWCGSSAANETETPFVRRSRKISRTVFGICEWSGVVCAIVIFAVIWIGVYYGRNNIQVVRQEIVSSRLPQGFDGYRIVQFSDLHLGGFGKDTVFVSRMVDSINALKPDVIVFTGDLVTRETMEMAPFLKVLRRLKARDGVYSVLGNHDYGDYRDWGSIGEKEQNLALLNAWQRQIGWKLLNNENVVLRHANDSIYLIGVENWGEPPFSQYGKLPEASHTSGNRSLLRDSNFKVLLSHNPEHWGREVTRISNIDLTLAGHTHAMQIVLGSGKNRVSPASLKYGDWGGLVCGHSDDGTPMDLYINIGAGEVGLPSRMLQAYPEITEITLRRNGK